MQLRKKYWGCFYFRREIVTLCSLLCGQCLAFMPGSSLTCHMIRYRDCPASSKSSIIAGAISTAGGSRTAAAEHRYSTRSSKLSSLFMILPSSLQSGTSSIRTRAQAKSNNSRHSEDPFRPERASPAPTIINALQRVLFHGEKAETAVTLTSEKRAASHEWKLTEDERQTVMTRVCGVAENLTELRFMLAAAVRRQVYNTLLTVVYWNRS